MRRLDIDMDYFEGIEDDIENVDVIDDNNKRKIKSATFPPIVAPPAPKKIVGFPQLEVVKPPAKQDTPNLSEVVDTPTENTDGNDKNGKKKKTMMFVGIGLGLLALSAVAIIFIKRKKK